MNSLSIRLFLLVAVIRFAAFSAVELPGAKSDGSILLPNQWSLRPAGRQIALGDFPVNIAVHPSGQYAAILHAGYGSHEVITVGLSNGRIIGRTTVEQAFYGLQFSRDGSRLFAAGGDEEVVNSFQFDRGLLSAPGKLRVRDVSERGVISGVAATGDGGTVFVTELFGMSISALDVGTGAPLWTLPLQPGAVATDLSKTRLSANPDLAAAEKRAAARKEKIDASAPFPYACVLDEPRNRLYVTAWGATNVTVVDLATRSVVAQWATEEHPNELLLTRSGKHLLVANANRNTVSVLDTGTGHVVETILAAMHAEDPPGNTPNSLALSPDEKRLFIANAGLNCIAVFDFEHPGTSHSLGFIPVGWYPTSVRVTPDGSTLLVANGKGIVSKSNRNGPQPGREPPGSVREYIGGLMQGTLSIIPLPKSDADFTKALAAWTAQALKCSPATTENSVLSKAPRGNPIPARVGGSSPIRHVIYIIKENRTYDQVLGDMPEGNGEPGLCLFPESVTPNHHKLAREFVLLDNFYVDGEVSADGHEWSMAAYATDFVEKTWPLSYGHGARGKFPYPSEGAFPIATPARGYIWDRAREAGVSYRSYGEFIAFEEGTDKPGHTSLESLQGHFDPYFRTFEMEYPDVKRAERFVSELKRFEREGEMPRLQIVRLPNDHTYGTARGKLSPRAFLGDNDKAFGAVVEAVSHSKFWSSTAIFVLEDDAQNGPDHVDAHRSIAFVISPYTKRHFRDSTMYSTASMLRTMELILGLKPMSQFDSAAAPMFNSFQAKADLRPYASVPVTVDLNEKNDALSWGAQMSEEMDFTREDAADDLKLNQVIWHSIKGPDVPMPAPVRAAFLMAKDNDPD
jgi:YVTN family beta-propeller protein